MHHHFGNFMAERSHVFGLAAVGGDFQCHG
jgi:hypothetical protein